MHSTAVFLSPPSTSGASHPTAAMAGTGDMLQYQGLSLSMTVPAGSMRQRSHLSQYAWTSTGGAAAAADAAAAASPRGSALATFGGRPRPAAGAPPAAVATLALPFGRPRFLPAGGSGGFPAPAPTSAAPRWPKNLPRERLLPALEFLITARLASSSASSSRSPTTSSASRLSAAPMAPPSCMTSFCTVFFCSARRKIFSSTVLPQMRR